MPLKDYTYWIDANLPPKSVTWLKEAFDVTAEHLYYMNLHTTNDPVIFEKAKNNPIPTIIITKDEDFVNMVLAKKSFPKIIWITAGNLSNDELKQLLTSNFHLAVKHLDLTDNYFVEIS